MTFEQSFFNFFLVFIKEGLCKKMINALHKWNNSKKSEYAKNFLRVCGAYGIIVVFAQDAGIRTGCLQARFTQNIWVQIVMFTSVAYSVTDDFFQSFSGTLIYFVLKYVLSKNVVNDVCFPGQCEIDKCGEKKKDSLIGV